MGERKKVVNPRFAKDDEYYKVLREIEEKGKCPFCPENFKYHKHPILKEEGTWFITKISWPYENADTHLIIISKEHKEQFSDITESDFNSIRILVNWAIQEFNLKGGAIAMRFGDTEHTGATVCHIHAQLIVPLEGKVVHFPIG